MTPRLRTAVSAFASAALLVTSAAASQAATRPAHSATRPAHPAARPSHPAARASAVPPRESFPGPWDTGYRVPTAALTVRLGVPVRGLGPDVCKITSGGRPGAPLVIRGVHFECEVYLAASYLTFQDDWFTLASPAAGSNLIQTGHTTTGVLLDHDTLGDTVPTNADEPITYTGYTMQWCDVSHVDDGAFVSTPGRVTIRDNWIHDLVQYSSAHHNDGVQVIGGADISIVHNWIETGHQENSALFFQTVNGPVTNLTVRDNYLGGGSFTFANYPGSSTLAPDFEHNWFGRDALYGLFVQRGGTVDWQDNRMFDTGALVPYVGRGNPPGTRTMIMNPRS